MRVKMYMIEGGLPLELVKKHIAEVLRVKEKIRELCDDLSEDSRVATEKGGSVSRITTDVFDGRLRGVVFKGAIHPDFAKKAVRGANYPKKGSYWAARFGAQAGYESPEKIIAKAFNVPTYVSYTSPDGCEGGKAIGPLFRSCGFLYVSKDGPYAMWTPDVAGEVADLEIAGWEVSPDIKDFKMPMDGLRAIEEEEWDILVLQHKLKEKKNGPDTASVEQ